jgi:hypothetical protein
VTSTSTPSSSATPQPLTIFLQVSCCLPACHSSVNDNAHLSCLQVIVTLQFSGLTAVSVIDNAFLLRLGLACYLNVSLPLVLVNSTLATAADSSEVRTLVPATARVNMEYAPCSRLNATTSRSLLCVAGALRNRRPEGMTPAVQVSSRVLGADKISAPEDSEPAGPRNTASLDGVVPNVQVSKMHACLFTEIS